MTSVYRVFARHGRLLYVGIATRLGVRLQQHEERSEWFPDAAVIEVSRFATREDALAVEGTAIEEESPVYNQRTSGRTARRRRHNAAADRQDIERRLVTARAKVGPLFDEVALYCDNSECVVREIRLHVKEHDRPLEPTLRCPSCAQQVKASWFGCVRRERVSEEVTSITTILAEPDDYEILA